MWVNMESQQFMKLNENNWNIWKFQMRVVLIAKDLFVITNGDIQKPDVLKAAELKKYEIYNVRAQEVLLMCVESRPQSHILMCKTANEIWTKQKTIYEHQLSMNIHLLQLQFFNLKSENGVMDFLSKI